MKVGFYRIGDEKKEIIYAHEFKTLMEAVYFFSKMKDLETDEFLKLYRVKQIVDEHSR